MICSTVKISGHRRVDHLGRRGARGRDRLGSQSVQVLVEERATEAPLPTDLDAGDLALVSEANQSPLGQFEVLRGFLGSEIRFHQVPLPATECGRIWLNTPFRV